MGFDVKMNNDVFVVQFELKRLTKSSRDVNMAVKIKNRLSVIRHADAVLLTYSSFVV